MFVAVAAVVACERNAALNSNENPRPDTVVPEPQNTPGTFSAADVAKLKWIVGSWKGTGDAEKPFFERYRFEAETIVAVDGFTDETFAKTDGTTLFALTDGVFGNSGETRWAASVITADSVTFIPVAGARNSFTWVKVSHNEWKATLTWPATVDKPARQRIYTMARIGK